MSEPTAPASVAQRFDLSTAFGSAAPHAVCCDCCEGYCPLADEGDDRWMGGLLYVYTTPDGVEYLTDRHVMLRRDLLDDEILTEQNLLPVPSIVAWASVPDAQPPLSDGPQGVHVLNACALLGLTRHEHEVPTFCHLYREGEHVGWTTIATKGLTEADLPVVRLIAQKCAIDLGRASVAYLTAQAGRSPEDNR